MWLDMFRLTQRALHSFKLSAMAGLSEGFPPKPAGTLGFEGRSP